MSFKALCGDLQQQHISDSCSQKNQETQSQSGSSQPKPKREYNSITIEAEESDLKGKDIFYNSSCCHTVVFQIAGITDLLKI